MLDTLLTCKNLQVSGLATAVFWSAISFAQANYGDTPMQNSSTVHGRHLIQNTSVLYRLNASAKTDFSHQTVGMYKVHAPRFVVIRY